MARRTTPKSIENVIRAVTQAGISADAIEFHDGGLIRIVLQGQSKLVKSKKELQCDDVFGVRLD